MLCQSLKIVLDVHLRVRLRESSADFLAWHKIFSLWLMPCGASAFMSFHRHKVHRLDVFALYVES